MKQRMLSIFAFVALTLSAASKAVEYGYPEPVDTQTHEIKPKIAIIVDDLGYQRESGYLLAQLPYPLTLAVIPDTPHASEVINGALSYGQEVILHVPMETLEKRPWEHGLTTDMDYDKIQLRLQQMLERYPNAVGINNHGGSKLTADFERMAWIMESLAERNMFFLDSRTTHESRAIDAAIMSQVKHASRDVFLDNIQDETAIETQFDKLKEIAKRHGSAIGIGHPHPTTIRSLQKQLPQLREEGFELTFCSKLTIRTEESHTNQAFSH